MKDIIIGREQRHSLAWSNEQRERYLELFIKGDDLTESEKVEIEDIEKIADEGEKTGYIHPCWFRYAGIEYNAINKKVPQIVYKLPNR